MKAMGETGWRQPMWSEIMHRLPASVTVNLNTQSYAVTDHTQKIIYADDVEEKDVDTLIGEWALELRAESRGEFLKTFSMKNLKRAWEAGEKNIILLSEMPGARMNALRTDAVFSRGTWNMTVEFRFDCFDIRSLILERGVRE